MGEQADESGTDRKDAGPSGYLSGSGFQLLATDQRQRGGGGQRCERFYRSEGVRQRPVRVGEESGRGV